jgi:hypothetical protein
LILVSNETAGLYALQRDESGRIIGIIRNLDLQTSASLNHWADDVSVVKEAALDPFEGYEPIPGLEELGRAIRDKDGNLSGSPANYELIRGSKESSIDPSILLEAINTTGPRPGIKIMRIVYEDGSEWSRLRTVNTPRTGAQIVAVEWEDSFTWTSSV